MLENLHRLSRTKDTHEISAPSEFHGEEIAALMFESCKPSRVACRADSYKAQVCQAAPEPQSSPRGQSPMDPALPSPASITGHAAVNSILFPHRVNAPSSDKPLPHEVSSMNYKNS
ncbi:hypothetical protein E2C01_079408 [Portunus trituberculatus]|uniref:Uncharacterized protein n=1 Tax=Portunus trituberculatus TaxID=210409 RepID=A0A5B7IQJ4_PORTR|nr:hypothetical protein [Portunus trituberculatus]